jgi:hypothetical protein
VVRCPGSPELRKTSFRQFWRQIKRVVVRRDKRDSIIRRANFRNVRRMSIGRVSVITYYAISYSVSNA